MRKKKFIAAACMLLIVGLILGLALSRVFKHSAQPTVATHRVAPSPENSLTLGEIAFPDLTEYQLQTKQNPNQTSEAILDFARSLGPQLEKARTSKTYAKALFGKLEDCALNQTLAPTRAVCTIDAGRILDDLPEESNDVPEKGFDEDSNHWSNQEKLELSLRVEHLRQSMPSDVQVLIESLE